MKNIIHALAIFIATTTFANSVSTYYCPIDRIIQQYTWPGIYKCPKCGYAMMPKH